MILQFVKSLFYSIYHFLVAAPRSPGAFTKERAQELWENSLVGPSRSLQYASEELSPAVGTLGSPS